MSKIKQWFSLMVQDKGETLDMFVIDEIGWDVGARDFIAAIAEHPDAKTLLLHINSPGGSVTD